MSALFAIDDDGAPVRVVELEGDGHDGARSVGATSPAAGVTGQVSSGINRTANGAPKSAVVAEADHAFSDAAISQAREAVMAMRRAIVGLGGVDPELLGGKVQLALADELASVLKKITAVRADVLAAIEAAGSWRGQGFRTLADRERKTSGTTKAESARMITRAKTLNNDLPKFREEVHSGSISMSHVDVVNRVASTPELRQRLTNSDDGEAQLLDAAKVMDPDRFAKHVRAWAIENEPEQCELEARRAEREEEVTLVERDGGWNLRGWLTPVNGALVNSVLTASMGVPTAADPRGPMERRAAALVGLCARVAEFGDVKKSALVAPHLSVHVSIETVLGAEMAAQVSRERAVRHGEEHSDTLGRVLATISSSYVPRLFEGLKPATLDDGTPLLPSELQTLLCNSEMSRVIFGAKGEVLDVGRKHRFVQKSQIRAVVARDKTCRFPGCEATISTSEVHHAQHWQHGGPTDLDNLVMLCWFHHRYVHQHDITIVHHENGWVFKTPTGRILSEPKRNSGKARSALSDAPGGPREDPSSGAGGDPPPGADREPPKNRASGAPPGG